MKKKLFLLGSIIFETHIAFCQPTEIQKIRTLYQQFEQRLNTQKDGSGDEGLYLNTLNINSGNRSNYPGVGSYYYNVSFYYELVPEKNMARKLLKIDVDENHAAPTYRAEFLFDDKAELVFVYLKSEEYPAKEIRYYFSKNKLIRYMEGQTLNDKPTAPQQAKSLRQQETARQLAQFFETQNRLPEVVEKN